MKYVIDIKIFMPILNYYYKDIFISFWKKFNELARGGIII